MPEPEKEKTEEMFDIDKLESLRASLKEQFPDFAKTEEFDQWARDVYKDSETSPQLYADKALQKERTARLYEAYNFKKTIEKLKVEAKELGEVAETVVNNTAERLTQKDLNHDGKIADKQIVPQRSVEILNAFEAMYDHDRGEYPEIYGNPQTAAQRLQILSDLSVIYVDAIHADRERYPDLYDTPEKAEAREEKLGEAYAELKEVFNKDLTEHPDYYISVESADARRNIVLANIEMKHGLHPEDSPQAKLAKDYPLGTLDAIRKTVTDQINANVPEKDRVSFESLVKIDNVRFADGEPLPKDLKPWEYERTIKETLEKGGTLLIADRNNKVMELTGNAEKQQFKQLDPNTKLIDAKVKKSAIAELQKVQKTLKEKGISENDTPEFKKLFESVDKTIKDLQNTAFEKKFKDTLNEFAKTADAYTFSQIGQKNTEIRVNRVNCAKDIANINKAVQENKEAEKAKPNLQDTLRFEIACKAVKTYANSFKDSKDKNKQGLAEHINSNEENFRKEVEKAMKDPAFIAMYGDKNHPVDEVELQKAAKGKGSDVLKNVKQKSKELDEKQISEIKQSQRREQTYNKDVVITDADQKAMQDLITSVREDMTKGKYTKGKDPALDKFVYELEVAETRLKMNAPGMNISKLSAQLADAAEELNQKSLNESGKRRTINTNKILQMDNLLREGKSIADNPYNERDGLERDIAAKIVMDTQKKLQKSDLAADKDQAVKLNDRKNFEKAIKEMRESKAFKEMVKDKDAEALQSLLKKDPHKLALELGKTQKDMEYKGLDKEKIKQLEEYKKGKEKIDHDLEKQKELESAKSQDGPSMMFR